MKLYTKMQETSAHMSSDDKSIPILPPHPSSNRAADSLPIFMIH